MRRFHDGSGGLPLVLAATWPLGVYTQIPLSGVLFSHLIALALAITAAVHWRTRRESRPPFEYWWPCALVVLIAVLGVLIGGGTRLLSLLPHCTFFLGAIILVPSRRAAAHACLAFSLACSAAAAVHWGAQAGLCPPTAFNRSVDLAVSGLATVQQSVVLSATGILAGVFAALHSGLGTLHRGAALAAAATIGAWFAGVVLPAGSVRGAIEFPAHFRNFPLDALIILLALWLAARVMARTVGMS